VRIPLLPACSQRSQIVREVRVRIPLLTACSQRSQIVRQVRVSIPPLPACSQQSQIHCYQRNSIHSSQLAPGEARLSERWEWAFHCYQWSQIVRCESEHSTATSLLPPIPDCQRGESENSTATSLLPAKPDPPLTACSQRSQIVREVRVSIPPLPACSQRSQIHHYHLTPSEATLSERWEWACRSSETKHIWGWKLNMSELCERAHQWWKWPCQSWSGSEYVRVVRVSIVMRVRVYTC